MGFTDSLDNAPCSGPNCQVPHAHSDVGRPTQPQKPLSEVFILWDVYGIEHYVDAVYASLESAQRDVPDAKWRYHEDQEAWTTKIRLKVPNNRTVLHEFMITKEEVRG